MSWGPSGALRMQNCRINLSSMFVYDSQQAEGKKSAAVIKLAWHSWRTRDGYDKIPTCVYAPRCHSALGGASLFLIVSLIIEFLLPTIQYVALKTKINNPLLLQLSILNITMCNNTPIVCFSVGLGGCICLFCAFLSPDSGRTEVMI